jgi:hypothetical protein
MPRTFSRREIAEGRVIERKKRSVATSGYGTTRAFATVRRDKGLSKDERAAATAVR